MYFYARLANKKGPPGPTSVCTTPGQAELFLETHDKPGHGVYLCPNPLKEDGDGSRTIENIAAIEVIWFDIDLRALLESEDKVETKLLGLALEPTEVNYTGGGYHLLYRLRDPILAENEEDFELACSLWKCLAARLGADPAPTHPAALMRCRGSHNTKHNDESREVRTVWGSGRPVDIVALQELEDLLPLDGLLKPKPVEEGDGRPAGSYNGTGEPVDVDQRLSSMCFEGAGDNCIHHTQVSVTAAMLRSGSSVDETVETVLEATRRIAPAGWDWDQEEHGLRGMCYDWINKHPELSTALPDDLWPAFEEVLAGGGTPKVKYDRFRGWQVRGKRKSNGAMGTEPAVKASQPISARRTGTLVIDCAAEIEPEPVEWVWKGRIARGKHTAFAGEPGVSKSQAAINIAATISKGGLWPNNEGRAPIGKVIFLSAEDGAADTIVPRLIAADADRSQVHIIKAVAEQGKGPRTFNLQTDLGLLEATIIELGDVQLVVIDPVSAYFGKGVDSHRDTEVRSVLAPVTEMSERLGTAILTIAHFNKSGNSGKALHKFMGSIAFVAGPRAAFAVIEDPDDPTCRLFLHAKNNLSAPPPGLSFRIEQVVLPIKDIETSRIVWDFGTVDMTADEAVAASQAGATAPTLEEAKDLVASLKGKNVKEIENAGKDAGISWSTMRRAKDKLGFRAVKDGMKGGWLWEKP